MSGHTEKVQTHAEKSKEIAKDAISDIGTEIKAGIKDSTEKISDKMEAVKAAIKE